jgi:hypothetical protein
LATNRRTILHAVRPGTEKTFAMDSDMFVRVVGAAIESVYNKGHAPR